MKRVSVTEIALVFIGLGIGWLLIGQALQGRLTLADIWTDLSTNAGTEAIGIAITVLVIDRLYERRDQEREKQRIIRQMTSPSNDFALEAVRLARDNGWLKDGSIHRANLLGANLTGANLSVANLTLAKYDDNTKWPDGFDPVAAGAFLVTKSNESKT